MLLSVKVIPNSKKLEISSLGENNYRIKIDAPANEGMANSRLIETFSDYFKIPKSSIKIIRGHKSRNKVLEIKP